MFPRVAILLSILCFSISTFSQTTELWGNAPYRNYGGLFSLDTNGSNYQSKFQFEQIGPNRLDFGRLCETTPGTFYGVAVDNKIFKYSQSTEEIEVVYIIKDTIDGREPRGSLLYASNGLLYGMTNKGGLYDLGVIFSFNPVTNVYTKLIEFNDFNGANPHGSLIQAANGKLYGMTYGGGSAASKLGVLFEYNIQTNTYTNLHNFANSTGYRPKGRLLQASNGRLYGTTTEGSCVKRIFEYNIFTSTYRNVGSNCNVGVGIKESSLIETSYGEIMGVSREDGPNVFDNGTLFSFLPGGNTVTVEYGFAFSAAGYGRPVGQLVQVGTYIYGYANEIHGRNNPGIWRFNLIFGSFSMLPSQFGRNETTGGLIRAANGAIMGVSSKHSGSSPGTVFQIANTTIGAENKALLGETNGENPRGGLVYASNGLIYGTTFIGGKNRTGTFFSYDPAYDKYESIFDFGGLTGERPLGTPIQANNGKIYGVTEGGGTDDKGVLYEYDPISKTLNKLFDFDSLSGHTPQRGVMQASNGKLYGTATHGGTYHEGVLFEYDLATNTYSKKREFYWFDGAHPVGKPIEIGNGILYGTTSDRGQNFNVGTLYKYDLNTNTFTKLKDFNPNITGGNARATLIEGANGELYGATISDAQNGEGAIFKYVISTNTLTKEKDLGGSSIGEVVEYQFKKNNDGTFLLTARNGGTLSRGAILHYNPQTNSIQPTVQFGNVGTSFYPYGTLLEIDICRPGRISKLTTSDSIVCSNDSAIIQIAQGDSLYDAQYWALYKDSCGGPAIDSNLTGRFVVFPNSPTNYYVRGAGGCIADTTECKSVFIYGVPTYNLTDSILLCLGENYTFPDGSTITKIQGDTTQISNLNTVIGGCDSIITTVIRVNPNPIYNISDTVRICYNSDYLFPDSTVIKNITTAITHTSYLQTLNTGCDSTITTTISLNDLDTTSNTISICAGDSLILPDSSISIPLFNDTVFATILTKQTTGCDSIVFSNVLVEGGDTTVINDTICFGSAYTLPDNLTINLSADTTIYTLLQTSNISCDSVIESRVVVSQIDTSIQVNRFTLTSNAVGVNYQWLNCSTNNVIAGEINQSYTATQNGTYAVELVNSEGCIDTSICYVILGVGIESGDFIEGIKVFPNPVKNEFNIDFGKKLFTGRVELQNLEGKIVFVRNLKNSGALNESLYISKGVYFLKFINIEGQHTYFKLLKE